MKTPFRIFTLVLSAALGSASMSAHTQTTLTVLSGGSQNMVDYVTDYLGPLFEKQNAGVKVVVVGVGPDDAGSQKILEKLQAQKTAATWDVDVIVPNQQKTGEMATAGLLLKYRDSIATGKYAVSQSSKQALGVNVDGYVMPMFESQTAMAYNPDLVKNPPSSYDELRAFVTKNPKQFGYNGLKNGMSGVAFVVGWMYAYGGNAAALQQGPYDAASKAGGGWSKAYADLKLFNQSVTFTPGNAGTLDMLNRGEIAMGPVWVDMFYTWKADGRLSPNLKLKLLSPGMPGQPYYYAIPAKAKNAELAKKFIALATSPAVQAEGIVKRFNWYPGIDPNVVKPSLDPKVWASLFTDISPADLAKNAKPFPIAPFFTDLREQYEKQVGN